MIFSKEKIKDYIHEYEYNQNAQDCGVKVLNLKIKGKVAIADIILTFDNGDRIERYNDCEYPLDFITQEGI